MQNLYAFSLLVPDYDVAIEFYCGTLGFQLAEDIDQGRKRWVRILPSGARQGSIILARADNEQQIAAIGNQFGGRVGMFLHTNSFAQDHAAMLAKGVHFEESPRHEPYGTVAVWQDPFGNRWDLLQLA
ncbi:VOC family protein [Parasedimentitalea huanghaiensis]|uniref:VOC family protein n=1 Tax=Parasedimentitalea huanghaiensis TaxID=2682100 RepID=A0A6L6WKS5_9RHOB|nr:VOC family protein [Zongyanglinia huanghaiensis]MVO18284.1 VOC family protein [Zongyanglinia huanghaiensis]